MSWRKTSSGIQRIFVDNMVQFTSDLQKVVQVILDADGPGNGYSLLIDGYTSPQTFTLTSDPDYDIFLYEVRFVFSAEQFKFDGQSFGPLPSLTNGVSVEITADGYTAEVANVKCNEDFMLFNAPSNVITAGYASDDVLAAGLVFGGEIILEKGSADKVRVTIADDLTSNLYNYFKCIIYGTRGLEE